MDWTDIENELSGYGANPEDMDLQNLYDNLANEGNVIGGGTGAIGNDEYREAMGDFYHNAIKRGVDITHLPDPTTCLNTEVQTLVNTTPAEKEDIEYSVSENAFQYRAKKAKKGVDKLLDRTNELDDAVRKANDKRKRNFLITQAEFGFLVATGGIGGYLLTRDDAKNGTGNGNGNGTNGNGNGDNGTPTQTPTPTPTETPTATPTPKPDYQYIENELDYEEFTTLFETFNESDKRALFGNARNYEELVNGNPNDGEVETATVFYQEGPEDSHIKYEMEDGLEGDKIPIPDDIAETLAKYEG